VLRAAFAQAMRWGWLWDNPAERAHRIVATTTEPRPPTPAELRALLDHVARRDAQLHTFWASPLIVEGPVMQLGRSR
jgi:hypothetical protein